MGFLPIEVALKGAQVVVHDTELAGGDACLDVPQLGQLCALCP